MSSAQIVSVRAREILDSRGRPTVEADVLLAGGALGRASVPSGASTGKHEAVELRDGDSRRYGGLGVRRAVGHVAEEISRGVAGLDATEQSTVDERLVELDGTPSKERLGANALLAVSLAACRAAALARAVPLYRHIADLTGTVPRIPLPMVNIISGGKHAGGQIDIQDLLVIPLSARSFTEALEQAVAVHRACADLVRRHHHPPLVADEGGWAPPLASNEEAIRWLVEAIELAGLRPGEDLGIALDVASTHFYDESSGRYRLARDGRELQAHELIDLLEAWSTRYPIRSIEDGLAEDDWQGWKSLTRRLGARVQLVGDDLFTTHPERLERGIRDGSANAVLVKVNQIGTLTEALRVSERAKAADYRVVVSARSGETEDSFIADLAVGCAADQIKVGSVTRSSRLAKWNQLLRIEEALGEAAYVGRRALAGAAQRFGRS